MKNLNRTWPNWYSSLADFRHSDSWKATWQLINTLVPCLCLWYGMVVLVQRGYSYLWVLLLALPTAAFLVRVFILFHDCVHGSLFKSKTANTVCGYLLGTFTFTPFEDWRYSHLKHHATNANLDARGFGDIWTMTKAEYESASKMKQLQYKLYRHPFVMFGVGSLYFFLISNRFPTRVTERKERMSVLSTNLCIAIMILLASWLVGWRAYFMTMLPVMWFAGIAGIWLFYVQHQFDGGYWAHKDEWEPLRAAMEGSSFYDLPSILRWFSGNIGYHHVHHIAPNIPNYHLQKCYDSIPELQVRWPLTLTQSFYSMRLKLWDEKQQKMVPFP